MLLYLNESGKSKVVDLLTCEGLSWTFECGFNCICTYSAFPNFEMHLFMYTLIFVYFIRGEV